MVKQYWPGGRSVESLVADVEQAVRSGSLTDGSLLPPVRELANRLDLSATTVANAYRTLRLRGIARGEGRRGTFINALSSVGDVDVEVPDGTRNLARGNPDPALLPDLRSHLMKAIPNSPDLYGSDLIDDNLAQACREMFVSDGVPNGKLILCNGALDGIERLLLTQLRPGDGVAVEDPCFAASHRLILGLGLVPVPVAIDDFGMTPGALAEALKNNNVRAVIATPRAHNPTGAAFNDERASALGKVLRKHPDLLVIEDDHAGPVAGVKAHSVCHGLSRWAIVRSFSKWLSPDFRTAAMIGDDITIERVASRYLLGAGWVSHMLQRTIASALRGREVAKGVARAAATYTSRRVALVDSLADIGISATGVSGLNVWIPVTSEAAVVSGLISRGWAVAPGEVFRMKTGPAIRVTTASLDVDQASEFANDLRLAMAHRTRSQSPTR